MIQKSSFITNEEEETLLERFKVLIKDSEFFDVLVGYFYTSGFYALYESLEDTKKIRILIGVGTNKETIDLMEKTQESKQQSLQLSDAKIKEHFSNKIEKEMALSEDNKEIEEGVYKFLEWLKNGKLEIKAYPSANIHTKLYIMTFAEGGRDKGRVITGSSNFTKSGLEDNLEFNIELHRPEDYDFALDKFDQLWDVAVNVKDKYIDTIQKRTWLNNTITPYQLYLKFLYEYFKNELKQQEDLFFRYTPSQFKKLEYQRQAVLNAKKILKEYGGVFISDVVGLGKTYISAMLANQLDGRNLVIAPPNLLRKDNPASWKNVFKGFNIPAEFESIGKLDSLIKRGTKYYKNVFIDESHRFRTQTNITYEKIARICRGKRVILVTATPYNNSPQDVLSQIKLFQKTKKSNIPALSDLKSFFAELEKRLKKVDRRKDYKKYIEITKKNAREIREKVLKYLMVRRTRHEVKKYFADDLSKQGLNFPEVENPTPLFYELNNQEDRIFDKTLQLLVQKFRYARYTPMLYYEGEKISQPEELAQRNMGKFMKILLIKRLESSFYAFRKSINRFIYSYERFLEEYEKGKVYVSKRYINNIFELLEEDNDKKVQELIEEEKADKYSAEDFNKKFKRDLEKDLQILKEIKNMWKSVSRDPKLTELIDKISTNQILKNNKLLIFTESKETAEYLTKNLQEKLTADKTLLFTGSSGKSTREKVIENFDANARFQKDNYRILVATEVLSEGVNLHRANVVINYDIPWNPTRLMQRVGRINRVDTEFSKIYTFNFFPTRQANTQIKLKEAAQAKIHAFIKLLGRDAQLLTEGEPIESHELFDKLISKETITGEDKKQESELEYLQTIKKVRDENPDLFNQIKKLPKKARSARSLKNYSNSVLTYFRKGKLQKFYLAKKDKAKELDFISAAKLLKTKPEAERKKIKKDFYKLLDCNKKDFRLATTEEAPGIKMKGGRDTATRILKIVKALTGDLKQFTEEQEDYLFKVKKQIEEGGLTKQTMKIALKELNREAKKGVKPLKLLAVLQKNIPDELLKEHFAESLAETTGPREVILSEYFTP